LSTDEISVQLTEYKLIDGTIVSIDTLEVGALVSVKLEDGTEVPLEDGKYELEDGTKFTLVHGTIDSLELPEVVEEPVKASEEDVLAAIASIMERITALESKIDTLINEEPSEDTAVDMSSKIDALSTKLSGITDVVEKLIGQPKSESVETKLSKHSIKEDKFEAMYNSLKSIKNQK